MRSTKRLTTRHAALRWAFLFGLAVRVYLLLLLSRLLINVVPLRRIAAYLGRSMQETDRMSLTDQETLFARRVGAMILRLAPLTPTNSNCYPQALTAWWLLSRRGIPSTYYYGARFQGDKSGLDAHVWLRSGPVIVTGGRVGPYKPLATFAADREFIKQLTPRRYRSVAVKASGGAT